MNRGKIYTYLIVLLFLSILFFQLIFSIPQKSLTYDEIAHLSAGYSYLKTGDYRMNKEHPPLAKLLAGIPLLFLRASIPLEDYSWREGREWLFGREFFYHNKIDADRLLFYGRIPIIFLSLLLGFFVFQWAKNLYGLNAGFFALFLYIFCPNIIGHSQLVTTDLAASCFIFLSVYSFWFYLNQPRKRNLVFAGITLGFALASKFTTVILFPIYFLLCLFFFRYIFSFAFFSSGKANLKLIIHFFCHFSGLLFSQF